MVSFHVTFHKIHSEINKLPLYLKHFKLFFYNIIIFHFTIATSGKTSVDRHVDFYETEPIPWYKFPKQLIEACENGKTPLPAHRRAMISILAEYQVEQLKTDSRSVSRKIAQRIVCKYPQSFSDQIEGAVLGDGSESLFCQLYTKIHYNRRIQTAAERPKESANSSGSMVQKKERSKIWKPMSMVALHMSLRYHLMKQWILNV